MSPQFFHDTNREGVTVSIIRVGLAETKDFSDGYDRIFGKKKDETQAQEQAKQEEKKDETTAQDQGEKAK
jgi:hypothetical protein